MELWTLATARLPTFLPLRTVTWLGARMKLNWIATPAAKVIFSFFLGRLMSPSTKPQSMSVLLRPRDDQAKPLPIRQGFDVELAELPFEDPTEVALDHPRSRCQVAERKMPAAISSYHDLLRMELAR